MPISFGVMLVKSLNSRSGIWSAVFKSLIANLFHGQESGALRTLNNLFATSSKVSKLEDGCRSHRQTSDVTGPRGPQGVEVMFEFSWQHKTPPSTGVCHQYLSTINSNLIDKISH